MRHLLVPLIVMSGLYFSDACAFADDIVCAAVVPCDSDGQVLPAFSKGACAPLYERLCERQRENDSRLNLNTCSEAEKALRAQVAKLESQLVQMRKRERRARAR